MNLSWMRRRVSGAVVASAVFGGMIVGATGCAGDVGPGDYQGFRIAATESEGSGTCSFGDEGDSSTFLEGATFVLFAISGADGEVFHLDVGGTVLKGFASETGFSFQGKATDVEVNGPLTITTNTSTTVSFDLDGTEVTNGKYSTKTEANCTAGDCMGFDPVNCTRSATFSGVAIDTGDVDFNSQTP